MTEATVTALALTLAAAETVGEIVEDTQAADLILALSVEIIAHPQETAVMLVGEAALPSISAASAVKSRLEATRSDHLD